MKSFKNKKTEIENKIIRYCEKKYNEEAKRKELINGEYWIDIEDLPNEFINEIVDIYKNIRIDFFC